MSRQESAPIERPLGPDILSAARYYLRGRRGLIALAGVAVVAGLALNWSWLVAVGVAPILITALPCVAMCALGLCMHKMTSGSSQPPDRVPHSGPDLSWMRQGDLTTALPPIAARANEPEPPATSASASAPIAAASCCSPTTERT